MDTSNRLVFTLFRWVSVVLGTCGTLLIIQHAGTFLAWFAIAMAFIAWFVVLGVFIAERHGPFGLLLAGIAGLVFAVVAMVSMGSPGAVLPQQSSVPAASTTALAPSANP